VDAPTIGLLLCRDKNRTIVEYALKGISQPMGVSSYTLGTLPAELEGVLPTVAEFEEELQKVSEGQEDALPEG
jgi:hypothetical protein